MAQRIYGPSYISFESALSQQGWIPESVPMIASATSRRSKTFKTPLGIFEFKRVVCAPFFSGVSREKTEASAYYLAKPLKALCDYIYVHKKNWPSLRPLVHSLRIEEEFLRSLKKSDFKELERAYRSRRVLQFLQKMQKELEK
ncbi:MAG: hypothetical protein HY609_00195 [Deltaproteobacteria bacterium]|nr:hypothetical protein [Deltaproteobacteria bacterium]